MSAPHILRASWREPLTVLAPYADEPFTLAFLSDGARGRWSYIVREPDEVFEIGDGDDPFAVLAAALGPRRDAPAGGPPFTGGAAGLACYELGDHVEALGLQRAPGWPDLVFGLYTSVLAFDHQRREVLAIGRSDAQARRAMDWLPAADVGLSGRQGPLAEAVVCEPPDRHERAVADVTRRIAAGELFQANIARRWRGRLGDGVRPFDLLARLAAESPAPFAAYLRLDERAVVSNAPERFVSLTAEGWAESRPIKGTAARGRDRTEDQCRAAALAASAKDRAENLMIVDLMRNDLARVASPGSVGVPDLCAVETFANVHHLVSTVRGRLREGLGAPDLLRAAFPPGSITGAPKVQAMKVIAEFEPPRGPFFGSMFFAGFDGAFDSSVLIRTVALTRDVEGWAFEARAGGGVVADSEPAAERRETEAKFAALSRALCGEGAGA